LGVPYGSSPGKVLGDWEKAVDAWKDAAKTWKDAGEAYEDAGDPENTHDRSSRRH